MQQQHQQQDHQQLLLLAGIAFINGPETVQSRFKGQQWLTLLN
jgi:hypothetical protein